MFMAILGMENTHYKLQFKTTRKKDDPPSHWFIAIEL